MPTSKVINGVMYNTNTAELIKSWANCHDCSNAKYCYEALYRKQNGEFFLHIEGGPLSEYGYSIPGGFRGANFIRPLTCDEAKKWAEEHLDGEKYVDIFGPVSEDAGWANPALLMPTEVVEAAQKAAAAAGMDLSKYMEKLILAADEVA